MLEINKLSVRYGGKTVLGDLSLTLQAGRIHALIGPSGCGKSTLLKVLCGIQPACGGAVLYNGAPLYNYAPLSDGLATQAAPSSQLPRIGYVPQNYGLLDWKTVEQNIFLPLRIGNTRLEGHELSEAQDAAHEVIDTLGLNEVLGRYPRELSGGQQQRAALARAFILRPDLLLMDEPFSALDAFTSANSRALFLDLWRKHKVTTLLITHNMHEAAELGQTILLMGPGGALTTLESDAFPEPAASTESAASPRLAASPDSSPCLPTQTTTPGSHASTSNHNLAAASATSPEAVRQRLVDRMSELLREVTLP